MRDATSSGETIHDLLLVLAGRVDDDLLGRARELVAVGEDTRAVELVTASLVAARAVLPAPVRSAVVAAARSARTDIDAADTLPSPRPEDGTEHRFATPRDGDPVAGALRALPARSLAGCQVLLTLRRTPAGSAPGPLPHPVVLVVAPPGGRPTEVLAYQVAVALERVGVHASVEVLTADAEPSEYHAAAMRDAVPVISVDDSADGPAFGRSDNGPPEREPTRRPPEPARRRVPDTAGLLGRPSAAQDAEPLGSPLPPARRPQRPESRHELQRHELQPHELQRHELQRHELQRHEPERPAAVAEEPDENPDEVTATGSGDPAAATLPADRRRTREVQPDPERRPVPAREDAAERRPPRPISAGRLRRPSVTPISRASVPNPIPLRRSGPIPVARQLTPVEPPAKRDPDDRHDERDLDSAADRAADEVTEAPVTEHGRRPRRREASVFDSPSDPLNGPLNEPLMDPLLDPTVHDDGPLGVAEPRPAKDRPRTARPAAATNDDEWSADWFSGTWAMAPSALDRTPSTRDQHPDRDDDPAPVEEQASSRPPPRHPARHRYENGPEATPHEPAEPVAEEEPAPARPETNHEAHPEPDPELDGTNLGLRPESVARLSDADRQLLARLQAELQEGRRPRVTRRAGIGNSFGPGDGGRGTNGSGTYGSGTNGSGSNGSGTNGSRSNGSRNDRPGNNGHRSDPPDLAG